MNSERFILSAILALALVRGIIYASVVPPWQAPDEPAQFERVRAAFNTTDWNSKAHNGPAWYGELLQSLFTFDFWSLSNSPRKSYEPQGPLGYYIDLYNEVYGGTYGNRFTYAVMGWPLLGAPQANLVFQLYLARLNTVLMNVGMILLAYLTTRLIFPGNNLLTWGVPLLILFNPQHSHVLSTVNNGNLVELLITATLYFITRNILVGFSPLNVAAILVCSFLAIWTKATAFFILIPLAGLAGMYLWQYRRLGWYLLPVGLVLAPLTFYLAPARFKELIGQTWSLVYHLQLHLDSGLIPHIFRSFWAMPGWINIYIDQAWYNCLLWFCGVSLIGLIGWIIGQRRQLFTGQSLPATRVLIIFALAITTAIFIQVGWHILTGTLNYRQGRSLYPVIVPLSIFTLLGWHQLLPIAWQKIELLTLALLFFLFDTMVLWNYIIPFFYSRF